MAQKENLAGFSGSSTGRKSRNCGVTAVSVITRTPFKEVWSYMRSASSHSLKWTGATTLRECKQALKHFGKVLGKEQNFLKSGEFLRLQDWHYYYAKRDQTYFLGVSGHWCTYRNGEVFDQTTKGEFVPLSRHWTSTKKMWTAIEVH